MPTSLSLTDESLFAIGLCDLALGLRGQHNGSQDPWEQERVDLIVGYLSKRVRDWRPSHPHSLAFDTAVRSMVIAALEEVSIAT